VREPADTGLIQSIKQRLLNLSMRTNETHNVILVRFAVERFLYRLSVSRHKEDLILKGAMLFAAWSRIPHRSTRDVDFLGSGASSPTRMAMIFGELCELDVSPDGMTFDRSTLVVRPIRADAAHDGLRTTLLAKLGSARIPLQIDVGFGDSITPEPRWLELHSMLDLPHARIRTYPPETVIAEKLDAILTLGLANSRMKDYFDLAILSRTMTFSATSLKAAIRATIARRGHDMPQQLPVGLTDAFGLDPAKQLQWKAFLRKSNLHESRSLVEIIAEIREFLMPLLADASTAESSWMPGRGWH